MIRLSIDYECPAPEWWESGGRDLWESVVDHPDDGSVVLDRAVADSVLAQAAQLPGWSGGHEFAPHPLRLIELDEDEEV